MKVLIISAMPDQINSNLGMKIYLVKGFSEILGKKKVRHTDIYFACDVLESFKPDLALVFGSCLPHESEYSFIRKKCDDLKIPLAFWMHDDPYEFDFKYKIVDYADIIFTNDKWASYHYGRENVFHLPMAACPQTHFRPIDSLKKIDIFFCGVAFENRLALLEGLKSVLKKFNTQIYGDGWDEKNLPFTKNQRIPNKELSDFYAKSHIILNMGRNLHFANERFMLTPSTPGPRTFEAGMAGALQMFFVDSLEIIKYYTPDKEILLFNNINDFEEKVINIFQYPEKAIQLRKAAQRRTLHDHTYKKRAETILKISETKLNLKY